MIHINKSRHGFTVQTRSSTAVDHEVLNSTTKQTFSRKEGALTNIKAVMIEWNSPFIFIQDNTGPEPIIIKLDADGTVIVQKNMVPETRPSKKKAAKKKTKAA